MEHDAICIKCGHTWIKRKDYPKSCPGCHAYNCVKIGETIVSRKVIVKKSELKQSDPNKIALHKIE